MGRKERCPQCGSKKITITGNLKKCGVCQYTWLGRPGRKRLRKEKSDSRGELQNVVTKPMVLGFWGLKFNLWGGYDSYVSYRYFNAYDYYDDDTHNYYYTYKLYDTNG